ncbi:hypothetical protein WN943_000235 [Citrus x changshan-huyou]
MTKPSDLLFPPPDNNGIFFPGGEGDDRSDEDMFEVIISSKAGPSIAPRAEVFACTVGRKPSKAKYYLDDTVEIVRLMQGLACVANQMVPV